MLRRMTQVTDEKSVPPPQMPTRRGKWLIGLLVAAAGLALGCFTLWSVSYYPRDMFADLRAEPLRGRKTVLVKGYVVSSGFFCVGTIHHREHGEELNIRMRYRLICPNQRSG